MASVTAERSRDRAAQADRSGALTPAPLEWRVVDDVARDGALNMALDEALARDLGEDRAVLRLYGWSNPTVSFGRNEPALAAYSEELAAAHGLSLVRRPTGGRAVLHDRELTYSVVMPIRAAGGVRAAYRRINVALTRAISALGAAVEMSGNDAVASLDAGPCFGTPARGEVVASGRKLVGSAQVRIGKVLLQHGSVLLAGDQSLLARIRRNNSPTTGGETDVSLDSLVGPVSEQALRAEVARGMQGEFGGSWRGGGVSEEERLRAEELADVRYRTSEWTWRR